jgi:uncharacterized protein
MMALFLDTSALVKRYITEPGSVWMTAQCQPGAKNTVIISQAAHIEAVATFCRKARAINPVLRITLDKRDELISVLRQDIRDEYESVNVTKTIYKVAGDLCRIHQLRAYDAVQLVCALTMRTKLINSGLSAPRFVSADNKLLDIASMEGFTVENPNDYP